MSIFKDLIKYPRFFITSLLGLVLIITSPILQLIKKSSNRVGIILIFLVFISGILVTLLKMFNY